MRIIPLSSQEKNYSKKTEFEKGEAFQRHHIIRCLRYKGDIGTITDAEYLGEKMMVSTLKNIVSEIKKKIQRCRFIFICV